ncbi:unnamed protein product [Adineta ricciae]|uniref:Uncharacterized protein n=2 Tax=Adineta ricciae TaxID=249248 RepID=A0A815NTP4_ADIRI|nr:unnamed protein product [Adineta ricciae]
MLTSKLVTVVNDTHLPLQEIKHKSVVLIEISNNNISSLFQIRTRTYCVLLLITVALSIVRFAIGQSYIDQCPIEPHIPISLWISGVIGIITFLLSGLLIVSPGFVGPSELRIENNEVVVQTPLLTRIFSILVALLNVILVVWLIYGTYLTYNVYNRIHRSKKIKHQFYCDETLHKYNTVLLVGSFVTTIAQCYYTAIRLQRFSTFCTLLAANTNCRVFL